MTYKLPILNYNYDALEPFFDYQTMKIHHTKHHQNYINNTNILLKNNNITHIPIKELLSSIHTYHLNTQQQTLLYNNAGGHANHNFFWKILKKNTKMNDIITKALINNFGSINFFQKIFEQQALNVFGSGWIWLIKQNNTLQITTTMNQNNPWIHIKNNILGEPILALDLWEHAYYLKYQNNRNLYIQSFWHVINWDKVTELFLKNNS
ncbi:Fe-Mn family superoxide dismutase [Enterobacteriaceae endosymbiont of Macroplea appendiculata]|uniref:Fe-Mn family superoxide dismutase n=1 Tax=Enterobacteriaceae endosymbiont of Macroplea appendiculata TaxID=2675790 RepID=UPI0014491AF7|nr:Fe-Mn family superoxide dismutase [Enterobacteriaceae endosymbiont of Macroplea appendiculata]QJC30858.1 superoxide dismutase [Mn] [Enterobacteriaceae endosymbiont of Macroplea appendiculata]